MLKRRCSKTVVVIEDESNIRNFAARVLELEGYRVCRTGDGAIGMDIIKDDGVSLVLLDLCLRGGPDGWSILRALKQDPRLSAIPVVVMTASAGNAQRRRTLRMGAATYLTKPVSARELIRAVRETLKLASGNRRAVAPLPVS